MEVERGDEDDCGGYDVSVDSCDDGTAVTHFICFDCCSCCCCYCCGIFVRVGVVIVVDIFFHNV